jgi:hypothetical protein
LDGRKASWRLPKQATSSAGCHSATPSSHLFPCHATASCIYHQTGQRGSETTPAPPPHILHLLHSCLVSCRTRNLPGVLYSGLGICTATDLQLRGTTPGGSWDRRHSTAPGGYHHPLLSNRRHMTFGLPSACSSRDCCYFRCTRCFEATPKLLQRPSQRRRLVVGRFTNRLKRPCHHWPHLCLADAATRVVRRIQISLRMRVLHTSADLGRSGSFVLFVAWLFFTFSDSTPFDSPLCCH